MHLRLAVFLFLLIACIARAGDSVLVFNEIQYHPADEATQTEWVELRSLQGVDVDISGWWIEGGIDYKFPPGTIMPGGGHLVIAATPGQISGSLGPFTGQLDNGGETLRLMHRSGRLMDEVSYDDEGEWTVGPDGSGVTLARLEDSAAAGAREWTTSAAFGGTPGALNFTPAGTAPALKVNEIAGASSESFFVELRNMASTPLDTSGWSLRVSTGQIIALPAVTLPAGGLLVLDAGQLGFTPTDGSRLFLVGPGDGFLGDAREVTNRLRGLTADGQWGYPTSATPGAENVAAISDAIVINEIFYHGVGNSPEQWIELHNRSTSAVDLTGWEISDGIQFTFPAGTNIPAGGFLVVAWDPAAFAALHPGITALGPWDGNLSGRGETITLRDADRNVADQITYSDGGRWSEWADGGGSSLELQDAHADNAKGDAWEASDESVHSGWQTVTYSGPGTAPNISDPPSSSHPIGYNEFVFGLLNSGEFLIDDMSVKDVTLGNVELIQNGSFSGGSAAWRIIGTHSGTVIDDPETPGNKVLKITATGATEHMHNHAETTLKNGASYHSVDPSHTYTISFRARWLRGSNRLHTRLWHNRLARQTLLAQPSTGGTPGAANSRVLPNVGPVYDALEHSPVIPSASQPATVSIKIADNDGVSDVQLFTSINGTAFASSAMTSTGGGVYSGMVPGQSGGAVVQFYVRATDSLGAVSFFPADGPTSRAMIQWEDSRARLQLPSGAQPHNIRIILPRADATELYKLENLMSDRAIPCTVVLDERKVYYRARVRLKSSEHGRISDQRCGYTLEFPSDDLFLGVHDTVSIDRSGGIGGGQKEILLKTLSNLAGGIVAPEDDIIRVITPLGTSPGAFTGATMTGPAILSKTRLDREFLDDQFPNGGDGPMFKYERVYVLTETINPATRAVTTMSGANVLTALAENPKVPQSSTGPPGVGVTYLGSNKENYRWYWLIQNARDADDYTGMIGVSQALTLSGGATFNTWTAQRIEVNTWLRSTVPATLFGVIDNYLGAGGGQHNALIYFPPGQKAVLIPWDLDYLNQSNAMATLTAGGDVTKFLTNPTYKRLFYANLLDVLNRSFNTTTMTRWATHYSRFGTEDMTALLPYLTQRAAYARNVVNGTGGQVAPIPPVSFTRTSPSPTSVSTPFATVSGDGWINISEIRLQGSPQPLPVTWTDDNSWTLQLPITTGTNTYTLVAYDNTGTQLGTASVTITGTGSIFPAGPGSLVVSELHYNPPGSTDATEFIELLNITGAAVDLSGCHFDEEDGQGISYTFPAGVQVGAGGRIIIPGNRSAFLAAYGDSGAQVVTNQFDPSALDNSGESLVLYAASGLEIFRFSYADSIPSTDGNGHSLVRVLSGTNPDPNSYFWRASTEAGGNPGGNDALPFSGDGLADTDQDGFTALLEYCFGTSDGEFTPPPFHLERDSLGRWLLTVSRAANADDAVLGVETVGTLGQPWIPAGVMLVASSVQGIIVTEVWEITPPAATGTSFFLRLRATLR